jgi:hypothetical protein
MWLGPAPMRPFNENHLHYAWNWFWNYAGGDIADDGIRQLDLARWCIGRTHPRSVSSTGGIHFLKERDLQPLLREWRYFAAGLNSTRYCIMRTYIKNRRRTQLCVESLEGRALLSAGAVAHHVSHHVAVAPANAAFTGTLTGHYSEVHAPYFANIESFATSGTLTGIGSAHLYGTLFVRPSAVAGRLLGRLLVRNHGGGMILNVYASGTAGAYSYKVARAGGSDAGFRHDTGSLRITLNPTFSVPYYTSGDATMTFG